MFDPSWNSEMQKMGFGEVERAEPGVDFSAKAATSDKGRLIALLERCYKFLGDNCHKEEETASLLMADIEEAIEVV